MRRGRPPEGANAATLYFLRLLLIDPEGEDWNLARFILNDWWLLGQDAIHGCECEEMCTKESLVEQLTPLIGRVLYPNSPPIPMMARWMKSWNTIVWFTLQFALHGIGTVGHVADLWRASSI